MYPILLSFSTHFSTLFINNSSIQNTLSQDNLSQNKILLIFCAACFAGYFIAYIKKRPSALLFVIGRSTAGLGFIYFFNIFLTFYHSNDICGIVISSSFTFLTFSALQETSSLELELIRLQALYVQFLAFQEQFCYML